MLTAECVQYLKKFEPGGSSDGSHSIHNGRTVLSRRVENSLTDFSSVPQSLKRNSDCVMTLHFCEVLLQKDPEIFVLQPGSSPSTPTLTQLKCGEGSERDQYTTAFLQWVVSRTVAVLGRKSCVGLHALARGLIHKILQTVKSRDCYQYVCILKEFIGCLTDLVQINVSLYDGFDPIRLNRFSVDMAHVLESLQDPRQSSESSDVTLSAADFVIDSVENCELFQLNITKVLGQVTWDLGQYCVKEVVYLWRCLTCHIDLDSILVQTESLKVMSDMISQHAVCLSPVLDGFEACFLSVMEMLFTGFYDQQEQSGDIPLTCILELEKAAARLFNQFSSPGGVTLLSNTQLEAILSKMATQQEVGGMSRLRTLEMKQAFVNMFRFIQERIAVAAMMSDNLKPFRSQLIATLICELGSGVKQQYLVAPLVKAIMCELTAKGVTSGGGQEKQETDGGKTAGSQSVLPGKRKRKLEDNATQSNISQSSKAQGSKTWVLLTKKLKEITEQRETKGSISGQVEGLRAVMEVMVTCVSLYSSKQSANRNSGSGELGQFHSWVSQDQLQAAVGFLVSQLQQSASLREQPETLRLCVASVINTVGSVLAVQDCTELDQDTYQTLCWITSLPWLLNDPSWLDLKPTNSREIVKIASSLVEHLDCATTSESLHVLSLLPKEVASKWRVHVFRQALSDSQVEVRSAALATFPMLLFHLGPNANHLVYDLIHPCVEEKSEDILQTLAEITGPLACIISRKAVINRCDSVLTTEPLYRSIIIGCTSCECSSYEDVSGSPRERPRLVDPNMFSPFLQLVHTDYKSVKLKLVKSMKRMFGHIGVRKNNSSTIAVLNLGLVLIGDPTYNVRREFSQVIQYLLGDCREGSDGTNELVLSKLKKVFTAAQKSKNLRLQETVLLTIAQLGRVAEGEMLVVVIVVLLESILSPYPLVASVAYLELKEIAKHKKTKTQNLFKKCRLAVFKFLVEAMHDAPNDKSALWILEKVAEVLDFKDVKSFLTGNEKYIVPYLVSKGTPKASGLIKVVATQLSLPSRSKLLIQNTKYVFSHLLRFCQKETDLQSAVSFLQKETEFDLRDLLRIDFQQVHNELLLHLSTNYSQIFKGLKTLASFDKDELVINSREEMAAYLQPRLLGVLAHFDSLLLTSNIPMEEKTPAFESLIAIIRLMGAKHISAIRHKVLNTLRIGLQFKDQKFMEISCRAWNCFVRSLELPLLGQMLPQIIATLLPLLKQMPKQVAEIFNFMIVENRTALRGHFPDIYFLPEMPELNDANAVLKESTDGPSSKRDSKTRLEHAMRGITHENLDVRLHALSKLKKLLQEEREAMLQYVVGSETADPVVTKLISVLLTGCRETDVRAQRLHAECLGQIGAIDPGRLEVSSKNPRAGGMAKFYASIQDEKFADGLITQVVSSYLAATRPTIQDCSAFALQELVAIYRVQAPSEAEPQGNALWKGFPEMIQEILIPLLSSKYMLTPGSKWSVLQKPIYCSKEGNTFQKWVTTWTGYLSTKVKPDEKPYKVFYACSAVIKHDVHIALYILPYVVLHVLLDGSDQDIEEICSEIMEVLNQVKRHDTKQQKSTSNFHHMSAQTVFSVLDYLTKWKRFRAQMKAAEAGPAKAASYLADREYKVVDEFLMKIPQEVLADVSFSCQAFTRSLMHFEQFIQVRDHYQPEHLDFMQRLYVAMDEPDGVLGVAAIRQSSPTLMEQVLTQGKLGKQHEVQACYEQAIQLEPDDVNHHQGLLRSILDLGQPSKALHHATGVIAERQEWSQQLNAFQVEAAWKLGNWDKLETFTKADKGSRSWPVVMGKILLAAKDKKKEDFYQQLQVVRQEQIGPLSAASMEMGSYQRGYEYIVRLHMLTEMEETMMVLMKMAPVSSEDVQEVGAGPLLSHWQARLGVMQTSFRIQEPVLTLRRILLAMAQQGADAQTNFDREIGQCWLWSAKIARKAGYLQTAYSSLLQASEYNLPEFCIEKAKWLWEKGVSEEAQALLVREMQVHYTDTSQLMSDHSDEGVCRRRVYAQVLLLYGRYIEESSNMESNAIVKRYKEVIKINPQWEDGHFYLAKYFDKIMTTLVEDKDRPDIARQGEFVVQVVKNFGQSLKFGNQFIYQSLPRMLSLWLDFGTAVVEHEKKDKTRSTPSSSQNLQNLRLTLVKLNKMIQEFGKTLAPYQLFSAFSQLISRLCHAQPDVFEQLKAIIARVVVSFPQQALWLLMAVSKSSYQMRVKRCQDIFATAVDMKPNLQKVIQDYIKLTERLLELCEDTRSASTLSVTQHFRPLKRLLEDSKFSKILLPLQTFMTPALPNTTDSMHHHNPFQGNLVYIRGLDDTIAILPSLQKPKKITFIGSDGHYYDMMCKPKDDLRKDCRLMEFNGIINKFLRKDPESRRRQLLIRTYTVIPLNEECGMLEWVNNTSGLRHILIKLYREKGTYTSGKELKAMMPVLQAPLETKLQTFRQKLLPKHPPVFSDWFLRTFPDPTAWYNARLAYARSLAVMSVVGYILGLGDRHGENILFDSTSGDCVHVDFNCLFNKGETFEWPEKVPFRLTHNLIMALGPLKLEGIYRRVCEVTLRVMRNQMDPLMSLLKPFVYDPLVEWSKPTRGPRSDSGEITNEQALTHVLNIEHRLKGILKNKTKPRGLALSVEGHINYLIEEATDEKNLCQMYIGWAAYL